MKVSVITISYNTCELLRKSLRSVFDDPCEHELEVIVVDNASVDGSAAMVREEFPQVQLIENSENMGFAAACNQAYQLSTGDFILLLNSDAWLQSGAINSAVAFMNEHVECGICGGHLVKPDGSFAPSARRFPNVLYKLLLMSGLSDKHPQSKVFGRPDYTHFDHKSVLEVDWVPGCFTIFRRSLLDGLGMFDERYYMYFEEVDLCLRAKSCGWRIYFNPGSQVVHIGGASSAKQADESWDASAAQLLKFRVRSEALYFRKNFGWGSMMGNLLTEMGWNAMVYAYNLRGNGDRHQMKRKTAADTIRHIFLALKDTRMGTEAPPAPW